MEKANEVQPKNLTKDRRKLVVGNALMLIVMVIRKKEKRKKKASHVQPRFFLLIFKMNDSHRLTYSRGEKWQRATWYSICSSEQIAGVIEN